jgi:glyoxylase-like metal-dependent hydrolase (beta-lactamase superfamily II)
MDVIRLAPDLSFLRFPVGNAYLWQDPDGLTLIDSGVPGSARLIADAIRQLGHQPAELRRLVLTHFHVDHVGAAAEIARWGEVEVFAHRADAPFIQGKAEGPPPQLLDWERPLYEQYSVKVIPDPVKVDRVLDDGDVLAFGGGARAVAAPGHTPGSVALHLPGLNVLFTGDTVARTQDGAVILGVFNADPAQAADSFRQLAKLEPEMVCFGHGEPLINDAAAKLRAAATRMPL